MCDVWVCLLGEHPAVGGHIVHQLGESGPLDLFALQVDHRVHEVKEHGALLQLLRKQLLLLGGGGVWTHTKTHTHTHTEFMIRIGQNQKFIMQFIMSSSEYILHI